MSEEQEPGSRSVGLIPRLNAWIPTSERLPEDGASVAFVVRSSGAFEYLNGLVLGGIYNANKYSGGFSVPGLVIGASYWLPLPPAPNETSETNDEGQANTPTSAATPGSRF